MAALKYWLWLTNLPGLSNRSCWQLLEHFDSPEEIYYADEGHLRLVDGLSEEQRQRLQDKSLHRAEEILALVDRPMPFSAINQKVCAHYSLLTRQPRRALRFERNVRFFVEFLADEGYLNTECVEGTAYYAQSGKKFRE